MEAASETFSMDAVYWIAAKTKGFENMKKCLFFLILACCAAQGCVKMYTLPDPPPKAEWVDIALANEDPEIRAKRMTNAKRALLQCYGALTAKKWDKALGCMSEDTLRAISAASDGAGPEAVFESGMVSIRGEKQVFDPVGDVFITGLSDIRDDFGTREDVENTTRHVFYAVDASGNAREIVMILEDDQWVIDRPQIFSPTLP